MIVLDESKMEDFLEEISQRVLEKLKPYLKTDETSLKKSGWLKSQDVKELLGGISDSTLQKMRIHDRLRYTKIMGTIYYRFEDVERMMEYSEEMV